MNLSGADGVQPPVIFVILIVRRVDQTPVSIGTCDRNVHSAKGIHDAAEAVKFDHGSMVNTNAEVLLDGIFQQTHPAVGVAAGFSTLIGSVNALHSHSWDVYPRIARNGDERDLSFTIPDDGNEQCVGAMRRSRRSAV